MFLQNSFLLGIICNCNEYCAREPLCDPEPFGGAIAEKSRPPARPLSNPAYHNGLLWAMVGRECPCVSPNRARRLDVRKLEFTQLAASGVGWGKTKTNKLQSTTRAPPKAISCPFTGGHDSDKTNLTTRFQLRLCHAPQPPAPPVQPKATARLTKHRWQPKHDCGPKLKATLPPQALRLSKRCLFLRPMRPPEKRQSWHPARRRHAGPRISKPHQAKERSDKQRAFLTILHR